MKPRELIKLLERNGWHEVRQRGSHRIFKHPEIHDTISVPDHGNRDVPVGTLHTILKQAGLK